MDDPAAIVHATRIAITKTRHLDVTDITIYMPWPEYKATLRYFGFEWEPVNPENIEANHDDRPLKMLYSHLLVLRAGTIAQVLGRRPDGSQTGWAISTAPGAYGIKSESPPV